MRSHWEFPLALLVVILTAVVAMLILFPPFTKTETVVKRVPARHMGLVHSPAYDDSTPFGNGLTMECEAWSSVKVTPNSQHEPKEGERFMTDCVIVRTA